ncbi:MAG: hypothetical protein BWY64_00481 [bacterium ADurb.Bin363]|nr:MAG: hypothetical protein BWY64_00481 [bacterium ADurb.Bin363]
MKKYSFIVLIVFFIWNIISAEADGKDLIRPGSIKKIIIDPVTGEILSIFLETNQEEINKDTVF